MLKYFYGWRGWHWTVLTRKGSQRISSERTDALKRRMHFYGLPDTLGMLRKVPRVQLR